MHYKKLLIAWLTSFWIRILVRPLSSPDIRNDNKKAAAKIIFAGFFLMLINSFYAKMTVKMDIEPGKSYLLKPKTNSTLWRLKTVTGARIAVYCEPMGKECDHVSLEYGQKHSDMNQFCDDQSISSATLSIKNEILIKISTNRDQTKASCNVVATKPYLNDNYTPEEDSGEEGTFNGVATSCKCGWSNKPYDGRIVGGKKAGKNEFPFLAAICTTINRPFCGGAIITPYHVLTAAHCLDEIKNQLTVKNIIEASQDITPQLIVKVGINDLNKPEPTLQVHKVAHFTIHEDYSHEFQNNDIALIELKEKIKFNIFVGPICMPNVDAVTGTFVTVAGWGSNNIDLPHFLMKVKLKLIEPSICAAIYNFDSNMTLCAFGKGKDSCAGDSGGPLFSVNPVTNMYTIRALVSFAFEECAGSNPSVNANVLLQLNWIENEIKASKHQVNLCF